MLKVFGFVKRHPRLTHDEYRAGHVGYHNSFGRRLNNIRGYILNVASNRPVTASLGADLAARMTRNEPGNFDDQWDGWGQLMFDSLDDYLAARSPARDMPTQRGLEEDPSVAGVGGDLEYLYAGSPFQFHVDEYVMRPVLRPERKLYKLVQFGKRREGLAPELFRAYWTGKYASHMLTIPGLRGMIVNFRTELDVMSGFFAQDAEGFSAEGIKRRLNFYSGWDGIAEYWFDQPEQLVAARNDSLVDGPLTALEELLFSSVFYREVDETVAVLPKRDPAPTFYHR
jgi:hypothetical protein